MIALDQDKGNLWELHDSCCKITNANDVFARKER